jgi:purine-nucleoside phosphorylase
MLEKIKATVEFIQEKISELPEFGIVLGSGLGGLVNEIEIKTTLPYSSIPGFPISTVKGHGGNLIFGKFGGKEVVAMQGRFHFYEGYSMQEVTFPIRVMISLGIKRLIISNASGGMNPDYQVGDLVIIKDHINLFPTNPLIGKNIEELGPRFPDMNEAYDPVMIQSASAIAKKMQYRFHIGVYAGVTGPCFETPSEYKYLKTIGGDIVGMSTVPEVIVGRHQNIPCFAISVVTDLGGFEAGQKISHEEVLSAANASEIKLTSLIKELIQTSV